MRLDDDAHSPTDNQAFRDWFAGSKAVDGRGRPRRFYHGTSKDTDFKAFRVPRNGAWFTPDPFVASQYAKENDSQELQYDSATRRFTPVNSSARVIPVYLHVQNPYFIDEIPEKLLMAVNYRKAQADYFDELRAKGHDAVVLPDGSYVMIDQRAPWKIKSAIGNRTFSAKKKNIHEAQVVTEEVAVAPLPVVKNRSLARCTTVSCNAILEHFHLPKIVSAAQMPHTAEESVDLLRKRGLHCKPRPSIHGMSVASFVRTHQRGVWYIGTNDHAMAVVDGVLYDTERKGMDNRTVLLAFEIDRG